MTWNHLRTGSRRGVGARAALAATALGVSAAFVVFMPVFSQSGAAQVPQGNAASMPRTMSSSPARSGPTCLAFG